MVHVMTNPAISLAGAASVDSVPGSAVRRPLPPVAMPAEVADGGLIRIGAGLGQPPKRG